VGVHVSGAVSGHELQTDVLVEKLAILNRHI
jgi:hypothetical protein